ncbi:acyltransferase family protein [Hymenobacter metallicola]|uniref:Acyltransferase n=1 Tax=Hymenobacter metallicola TaxID=2563114 RepID=A0A4Z0QGK1_9BACT|nr:acyltransferase [Hymenobacter metallicola]TGE28864.1 acyltransferase [Hymenobacter metallicola]
MKPGSYFPALTGLRAVAAYCVFFFHFPPVEASGSGLGQLLHALCREGHLGVSIFFTLSGFLICQRYYHVEFTRRQLLAYARRRWARIYPVFFLVTTLTFLLNKLYAADNGLWLYIANITLLKGFSDGLAFTGIVQTWSLTVEECFYLLAPLLFWLGRRYSPRVWAGCGAALLLAGFVAYTWTGTGWELNFAQAHFMLIATLFGRSSEFLLGAAFALATPAEAVTQRATRAGSLLVLLALAALTGIQLYSGKVSIDTAGGVVVNNLLLPLGTGLLLSGLASEQTLLRRALSTAPLQVLGRASYCFYLLHMGVWHDQLLRWLPAGLPGLLRFGLVWLLTVALSVGLYYLVEKPVHGFLLRSTTRRQQPQPA